MRVGSTGMSSFGESDYEQDRRDGWRTIKHGMVCLPRKR